MKREEKMGELVLLKILFIGIVFFCIAGICLLLLINGKIKNPEQKRSETVKVERNGKVYAVPLFLKNGMWHTPFTTRENPMQLLFRKEKKAGINCIKSCMKNPYYEGIFEMLVKDRIIKEVAE